MECCCLLPLLPCLTKLMSVNDGPGYVARLLSASVNDFQSINQVYL